MSLQNLIDSLRAMNDHYKDFEVSPLSIEIDNDKLAEEFEISSQDGTSESDAEDVPTGEAANPDIWLKRIVDSDTYELLSGMLRSDSSDEELQSSLSDILGYERLDLVIELIQKRQDFLVS
jgi:hypothetical protein